MRHQHLVKGRRVEGEKGGWDVSEKEEEEEGASGL
jgi:hypothetical protein